MIWQEVIVALIIAWAVVSVSLAGTRASASPATAPLHPQSTHIH